MSNFFFKYYNAEMYDRQFEEWNYGMRETMIGILPRKFDNEQQFFI